MFRFCKKQCHGDNDLMKVVLFRYTAYLPKLVKVITSIKESLVTRCEMFQGDVNSPQLDHFEAEISGLILDYIKPTSNKLTMYWLRV